MHFPILDCWRIKAGEASSSLGGQVVNSVETLMGSIKNLSTQSIREFRLILFNMNGKLASYQVNLLRWPSQA